jgi:hypothetical protein
MLLKAEVSTEFMVFFGILLLFFVFFVGIMGTNSNDISESTMFASARNILNTVTNEINTAARIQGYYRKFFIPQKLSNGETYNISYDNNLRMVKIEWNNGKNIMANIITDNLNGNITPGTNVIKNLNGVVNISAS